MATAFTCDPAAARDCATELSRIQQAMDTMNQTFNAADGQTGSAKVEAALDHFFKDTSDNRNRMDALLQRASGLLLTLADDVEQTDAQLAASLDPAGTA